MRTLLWMWAYFTVGLVGVGATIMGLVILVMATFLESPLYALLIPVDTLAFTALCGAAMKCLDRSVDA